jgi:hypothetical protein
VETDLRLYLACMPAQREHPTLRVLFELPSPRAGDAGEASAGYQDHERSMARLGGSGSSGHYAWAVNGVATPVPYISVGWPRLTEFRLSARSCSRRCSPDLKHTGNRRSRR